MRSVEGSARAPHSRFVVQKSETVIRQVLNVLFVTEERETSELMVNGLESANFRREAYLWRVKALSIIAWRGMAWRHMAILLENCHSIYRFLPCFGHKYATTYHAKKCLLI